MNFYKNNNINEFLVPRIDNLFNNGFYLETILLFSNIFEEQIRWNILAQEEWINTIIKKYKFKIKINEYKKLEKKTLGELIEVFSKYCVDDTLIEEIKSFNSLRKEVIHHLLIGDINKLDNRILKSKNSIYKTLFRLSENQTNILKKHNRSIKREIKIKQ